MKNLLFRFCAFLFTLLLLSCTPRHHAPAIPGRPGPAYVQWLEEQTCLRKAPDLTAVVSGSMLMWKHPSRELPLSENPGAWFRVSPTLSAWAGKIPLTTAMTRKRVADRLATLGVSGIVLSGLADTGDEWAGLSPASGLGEDSTSLSLGRLAGKEDEYAAWTASLAGTGLLAGGELLPSFTGMGPDFFLSVRAVRDYPGLYAMTEISPALWSLLPSLKEKETGLLSARAQKDLEARGELPSDLEQDFFTPDLLPGGWAVTGPVPGVDGVKRRWAYRWHDRFNQPVLHWDDPSGAARRVMEASLILQAGLRHQALVGIRAGAWLGLDAAFTGADGRIVQTMEPGLSALRDLSRKAHRYGSAVFVQDVVPMERLPLLMNCGADFFFDSVLSPALETSLITQDSAPVRESLRRAMTLGLDQRRLWRLSPDGLPRPDFIPLLSLVPEPWKTMLVSSDAPAEGPRLNAATIAAMACGLAPGSSPDSEMASAMRETHELFLAARIFLPGMFMFSGTDLDGALPEGTNWPSTPPLWQLDSLPASSQGLPSGFHAYSRLSGNYMDSRIKAMLAARNASRISSGTLVDVPSCDSKAVFITVCSLPQGGFLAFFGNASQKEVTFSPSFSAWNEAAGKIDLLSGHSVSGKNMTLPSRGWSAVLLQ